MIENTGNRQETGGSFRMIDPKLIEAFHFMWDKFPEVVMLIHKNRTIIATNKAGEKAGLYPVNTKCSARPPVEAHRGCKANEALAHKEFKYKKRKGNHGDIYIYWLPIDEYPEYYVHFAVGLSFDYEYEHA